MHSYDTITVLILSNKKGFIFRKSVIIPFIENNYSCIFNEKRYSENSMSTKQFIKFLNRLLSFYCYVFTEFNNILMCFYLMKHRPLHILFQKPSLFNYHSGYFKYITTVVSMILQNFILPYVSRSLIIIFSNIFVWHVSVHSYPY